jgi:hypothetical protein
MESGFLSGRSPGSGDILAIVYKKYQLSTGIAKAVPAKAETVRS